jgi:hypothetical protein
MRGIGIVQQAWICSGADVNSRYDAEQQKKGEPGLQAGSIDQPLRD